MNAKAIKVFLGLTFGVNWLMVLLFLILGGKWNSFGSNLLTVLYMFVPMIAAIMVQKLIYKKPLARPLGISFRFNRWFLDAWLLPPLIAFATIGLSLLLPGVEYSPEMAGMFERYKNLLTPEQLAQMENQLKLLPVHPIWLSLFQGLIAGITVNAVAGFGEELGWRGFLQKELDRLSFWFSSLFIGLIWGIWHAPIILQGHNYPQHPVAGVFMMVLWCLLLAPIFSYIRLKSKSVIAAAIMHGTLNGTAGLSLLVVKGGNDLLVGVTGLTGCLVLFILDLLIFFMDRRLLKSSVT